MRTLPFMLALGMGRRLGLLLFVTTLSGFVTWLPGGPANSASEYVFRHDGVLGTSLDVVVVSASADQASLCERVLLDEIERLRRILSTYDPQSEISRLNRSHTPMACSDELIEVLHGYERWQQRSGNAFNGQLGGLIELWKQSARDDRLPAADAITALVARLGQPAWRIDDSARTVERLTDQPLNVNALGRGFIVGKAARLAWQSSPGLQGLLVNHGGDMLALGDCACRRGWAIGVANPSQPQENAPLLTALELRNMAVATSAAYERYLTIGGKRYSHIFDPRTGQPARGIASSTVVAPDNATANALATTLCVLTADQGIKLVESVPGAACLLVTDEGQEMRSRGFAQFEVARGAVLQDKQDKVEKKWPENFELSVTLTLITPGGKARRPYVAVWIENGEGKAVRTVAVWGKDQRWTKDLFQWWKLNGKQASLVKAVTRATRPPGKYTVVWDGLDDNGKAVEPGNYTVQVEVNREHGKYVRQTGKIDCALEPATLTLGKTAETGETVVQFGPKGKEK